MPKKIIAVAGPTASGKTALAIEIAKKYNGEVVSCDSMQIYKHMDIGTAKPTREEMEGIVHHMIDVAEPFENYSVADYVKAARECIEDVISRGKLPILAGGTGLYMDSVINNIEFTEDCKAEGLREELQKIADAEGVERLHAMLRERDAEAAEKIHPNNVRRVIRAIEVCETTGKTFTEISRNSRKEPIYDALIFGLEYERDVLYARINRRVDMMIEAGLIDEVKMLRDMGLGNEHTAMQAIGYKEFAEYLSNGTKLSDAIEKVKQESRRYAKRQLTWFKRNPSIIWFMLQEDYSLNKIYEKCFTFIDEFGII